MHDLSHRNVIRQETTTKHLFCIGKLSSLRVCFRHGISFILFLFVGVREFEIVNYNNRAPKFIE